MSMKATVRSSSCDLGRRELAGDDLAEEAVRVGRHAARRLSSLSDRDAAGPRPPARDRRAPRARSSAPRPRRRARRGRVDRRAAARRGLDARIEAEHAHGTYWVAARPALAAGAGRRGRGARRAAAARSRCSPARRPPPGSPTTSPPGPHLVPPAAAAAATTYNVVAEAGRPGRRAHARLHRPPRRRARRVHLRRALRSPRSPTASPTGTPGRPTSPPSCGSSSAGRRSSPSARSRRSRPLRRWAPSCRSGGAPRSPTSRRRASCPGANDNLTAVAARARARRACCASARAGVRVILLSTGSEESFMEGMRGFARRHFASLPPDRDALRLPRDRRLPAS